MARIQGRESEILSRDEQVLAYPLPAPVEKFKSKKIYPMTYEKPQPFTINKGIMAISNTALPHESENPQKIQKLVIIGIFRKLGWGIYGVIQKDTPERSTQWQKRA